MTDASCLEQFEQYLTDVKKASKNTLSSYLRDVRQLSEYLAANESVSLQTADEDVLCAYIDELRARGKSVATVSRAIASLKNFYLYMRDQGWIEKVPTGKLVPDKTTQKLPQILTSKEVELLLEQPQCVDMKGYRDRAMLELLYATGIRVSELINLEITDVDLTAAIIHCRSKDKSRAIPLYPKAVVALSEYIEFIRPQMIASPDEKSLFVNISGERMSRQGFWKILKQYGKAANLEDKLTPQTLRNSFAMHMVQNGIDMKSLQELMGHEDILATQVYFEHMRNRIKDIYDRTHPRA